MGVYCDTEGNDVLELLSDAKFKYDEYGLDASATADEFDSITIKGAKVTCMYSSGISIWAVKGTIVFEEGKATVTENDGDSVVYNKNRRFGNGYPRRFTGLILQRSRRPVCRTIG